MRADQQIWIVERHDDDGNHIVWIDPSFRNFMRENNISEKDLPRKDTLAKTRAGLTVDFTVHDKPFTVRQYWLQTGDNAAFKEAEVIETPEKPIKKSA